MAHTTLSQVPFCLFLKKMLSHQLTWSFFANGAATLALKLNTKNIGSGRRVDRQIVCLGLKQGLARRSPVSPFELEEALRPPTNLFTVEAPHTVTVVEVAKITGPNAPEETYHVVVDHRGFLPHWEGQVFGVMPPPENPFKPGDATKLSFFSAATSRYGEFFNGRTLGLCVLRLPNTTSEIMCTSKRPTREAMLLGDYNPNATHIFVATGTEVAPFRAHIRRFFKDDIPTFKYSGYSLEWPTMTVSSTTPNSNNIAGTTQNISEQDGGKKYLQDSVAEYAEEIFDLLENGAYIYCAGREESRIQLRRP
ncbi:hypothetical protein UlMin_041978 [Ulmus minor]